MSSFQKMKRQIRAMIELEATPAEMLAFLVKDYRPEFSLHTIEETIDLLRNNRSMIV